MCRPGNACGCGGGGSVSQLGALAVVAALLAAEVSAAATLIEDVLQIVLITVWTVVVLGVAGFAYVVRRDLRREAAAGRARASVARPVRRALPARPQLAIEQARPRVIQGRAEHAESPRPQRAGGTI